MRTTSAFTYTKSITSYVSHLGDKHNASFLKYLGKSLINPVTKVDKLRDILLYIIASFLLKHDFILLY